MRFLYFIVANPNLIGFLGECGVIIFCFHKIENKACKKDLLLAYLCLSLNLLLYSTTKLSSPVLEGFDRGSLLYFTSRAVFHTGVVFLYLYLSKTIPVRSCFLLALFYIGGYQFSIGVRLLVSSISLWPNELIMYLFSSLAVILVQFAWAFVIRYILTFSDLTHISVSRYGVIGTLTFMQIYIRWSLFPHMNSMLAPTLWFKQIEYPLIAMFGLLMVEVFYETSISMQAKADTARTEKLCLQYELQNARRQTKSADDVRRIYHDMKNHLLAMSNMTSSQQVQRYLENLVKQISSYEETVRTGCTIVDALLAEKITLANLDGISFNVCMNLETLGFVEPVDLVAIFGNAVDNAIEAVRKIPDKQKRHIYIKSINTPGFLTLVFANPYADIERDQTGMIITSKEDKENHGIGLVSMKRAAEKYGGILYTKQDTETHWFDLTVLLPLEVQPA